MIARQKAKGRLAGKVVDARETRELKKRKRDREFCFQIFETLIALITLWLSIDPDRIKAE